MADYAKSVMDKAASLFNKSEDDKANPTPQDTSPPELNTKDAAAFAKGTETKPDYMKNLKEGLGLK